MTFHDLYHEILGRNKYNQKLREYVIKPYKDGRYYSDCSSSICAMYQQLGYEIGFLNTAGMYRNGKKVDVKIEDGHIVSGFENLREGDALLFRGYPYESTDRPLGIGHVEAIYELGTSEATTTICGHGSGTPSLKNMRNYLTDRESNIMSNDKSKGLVSVVRFISEKETKTFKQGEIFRCTEYWNNGVKTVIEAKLTPTVEHLLVRSEPNYSLRPRWFYSPEKEGFVSAYKVKGWVFEKKSERWWYVEDNFTYPTFCALDLGDKEYHFDKNGYMIDGTRFDENGAIIY